MPTFCAALGAASLGAFWLGGDPGAGVWALGVMVAYGALLLLLGGRSEVVKVLRGRPSDERWSSFDLRATAFAGVVTAIVLVGGALYEVARGHEGGPYAPLCALFGLSYLAGLLWLRRRS